MNRISRSLKAKVIVLVFLISGILSSVLITISYRIYGMNIDKYFRNTTKKLSATEALAVDAEKLSAVAKATEKIYEQVWKEFGDDFDFEELDDEELEAYYARYDSVYEMQEFKDVLYELQQLAEANQVLYMYINLWDEDRGKVIYLVDGSVGTDDITPTGCIEVIEADNLVKIRKGDYNLPAYITNYEEYGWLCTATSNIYRNLPDGSEEIVAHAYVDISMNDVVEERHNFLIQLAFLQVLIMLLTSTIASGMINRRMVKPIKQVSDAADAFVNSMDNRHDTVFDKLSIKTGDEVEVLAKSIAKMEHEINDYIDSITHITAEKERIGAELNVATRIQSNMLPSIFPKFCDRRDFEIYATMNPAKEVGGDFYDFFFVDEDHLAIVMADVAGKGVPASLFMVIAKTMIKNRTLMAGGTPAEILADVNEQLCEGNEDGMFVTVWLGILDLNTGDGLAANAGHEHPVICRRNGEYEYVINRHSPAVATIDGIRFRQHAFHLDPGDKLFIYTDGVPEATDRADNMYGLDRLKDSLNRHKSDSTEALLKNLAADVAGFVGDADQFDDLTMLAFYFNGKQEAEKTES